jgi:hypothetical protein
MVMTRSERVLEIENEIARLSRRIKHVEAEDYPGRIPEAVRASYDEIVRMEFRIEDLEAERDAIFGGLMVVR